MNFSKFWEMTSFWPIGVESYNYSTLWHQNNWSQYFIRFSDRILIWLMYPMLMTTYNYKHLKTNAYTIHELKYIESLLSWPFFGFRVMCHMSVNNNIAGFRNKKWNKNYWLFRKFLKIFKIFFKFSEKYKKCCLVHYIQK